MPATNADEAIWVIRQLVHTKGKYAGKPFRLFDWQEDFIRSVLATNRANRRKVRRALLGIARKNGKTELIAALAIALMICEREAGGEIVAAAAKRDQARLILDAAKRMVWWSKINGRPLNDFIKVTRDGLYFPELDTKWIIVSSDGEKEHGLNPSVVIVDELHAQGEKTDLVDALDTAQGAREDPLWIALTTAGPIRKGVCYNEYKHLRSITSGVVNDPEFYGVWYEADPDLEIDDPKSWAQANPGLDTIVQRSFLQGQIKKVESGRLSEYTFRRLHRNEWTNALERWLPRKKWDACNGRPEFSDGQEVVIGLDAALRRDSFGVCMVGRSNGWVETEAGLQLPADIAHARVWEFRPEEGSEDYIDIEDVRILVLGLAARFRVTKVVYDPAYMTLLAQQLSEAGVNCEPFPQSAERMTTATETFQRLILEGRLRHGGDKVLEEQMAGLGIRETERGVRISKTKSGVIVDSVYAMVMALQAEFGDDIDEQQDFAEFA
jgi:phage terminase large subunit-like protein